MTASTPQPPIDTQALEKLLATHEPRWTTHGWERTYQVIHCVSGGGCDWKMRQKALMTDDYCHEQHRRHVAEVISAHLAAVTTERDTLAAARGGNTAHKHGGPCRHCGKSPEADGDHSCPCPYRDDDCPDHPLISSPITATPWPDDEPLGSPPPWPARAVVDGPTASDGDNT